MAEYIVEEPSDRSASWRVRELLDERGVEWRGGLPTETMVEADGLDLLYVALPDGRVRAFIRNYLTPEQAVEATLGDADATGERQRDAVEVVRCRDCKFYTPESMTREERGFGIYENVWEPGGCFNPSRCYSTWDHIEEQMVPIGIDTDPDGFCAWGERKEEVEQ